VDILCQLDDKISPEPGNIETPIPLAKNSGEDESYIKNKLQQKVKAGSCEGMSEKVLSHT